MHFKMRKRRRPSPLLLLGLFLVTSAPLPAAPCETGVAHVGSQLGVGRSLMANADVALLRSYSAPTLATCMEECCTGAYGSCSVASFKRNSSHDNCLHFYCRPLPKCRFLPSNSTDSFSFSSELNKTSSHRGTPVPSVSAKEEVATFSEEQFAHKNDNTTVKPRKGVESDLPFEEGHPGASVKPRKGVTKEDIPHSELLPASIFKSNVKPRKGVVDPTPSPPANTYEVMSALQRVFEDDTHSVSSAVEILPSTDSFTGPSAVVTPTSGLAASFTRQFVSAAVEEHIPTSTPTPAAYLAETYRTSVSGGSHDTLVVPTEVLNNDELSTTSEGSLEKHERTGAKSDKPDRTDISSDVTKAAITGVSSNELVAKGDRTSVSSSEGSLDNFVAKDKDDEDRYQSSMHLVLALVFGLLVLFAVLGVVAKRVYDGWLRRDYYRMNYLIDGIYNGVD